MVSQKNKAQPFERSRVLSWYGCVRPLLLLSGFLTLWPTVTVSVARAASQLSVEYSEWGFDDRGVPRKFNLLTLDIQNGSGQPYEGTLRLRRLTGTTPVGLEFVQPVFLGSGEKRKIQFTPYMFDSSDEWEVVWGNTLDDRFIIEKARLGIGSRVIFNSPTGSVGLASGLRGFREDRFPSSVIGTDTLQCVVLDHTPRWAGVQKRAFRDWLYRGGALHVLYGPDGRFPELPVAELNSPARPTRYGAGRIYWHGMQRGRLQDNREYVYSNIYPTARVSVPVISSGSRKDTANVDPTSMNFSMQGIGSEEMVTYSDWDSDVQIPFALRDFIQGRVKHNWLLIYSLAFVYLLLICPGGPLLARRLDYRLNLLALVVVVSGWSWLYSMVGARGYGELTSTQELAIARPLPEGRWDIEQWSGVFVTDGDTYPLTHRGETRHYSALVKDFERVDGYASDGKKGQMVVDIPPFTSRTMMHRRVVKMSAPEFTVLSTDWENGVLQEMSLRTEGEFPTPVHSARLIYEGTIYSINPVALQGVRTLQLNSVVPPESLLNLEQRNQIYQGRYRQRNQQSESDALDGMLPIILARDIGIRRMSDRNQFRLSRDIVRLCIFADLPDELACRDARTPDGVMGRNSGRILYSVDLPCDPPLVSGKNVPGSVSRPESRHTPSPADRGTP